MRMAVDIGPLVVFFAANALTRGPDLYRLLVGTAAFMVAMSIAMAISWWKARHISPMLWISGIMVLVFGGLTLYFHDPRFIKMKPTIYYVCFSLALFFGLATGRPLLQTLLGTAYPGLSARGWKILTVNWAIFFAGMAVANEVVWRTQSQDFWLGFKLVVIGLTIVFALVNIPMLMRHGLQIDEPAKDVPIPPEG
ncbi:MAG: septation protein IspZ [Pseudomonadota bacterium]